MERQPAKPTEASFGPKQIIISFLVVLVVYFAMYQWVEHRRHVHGPWMLEFSTDAQGVPILQIEQHGLSLSNRIRLEGESWFPANTAGSSPESREISLRLAITQPGLETPFGRIIYEDLTFLPGVVTLELFGHEVELMPRVLLANKKEQAWNQGEEIVLRPKDKPSLPPAPPEGGTRDQSNAPPTWP